MRTTESIVNFAPAFVAAQGEIEAAEKDRQNPAFKSKYTSLSAIVDAARPALAKHKLGVLQFPTIRTESKSIVVTTRVLHGSGEWVEDDLELPIAKWDAQGIGSGITYAKRYAYCAMIGVVADEDDDGNAASRRPVQQARPLSAAPPVPVNRSTGEELPSAAPDIFASELPPESTIPTPQQHTLWRIARESGWTQDEVKYYLAEAHNLASTKDIPKSQFDAICTVLRDGRDVPTGAQ